MIHTSFQKTYKS